MTSIRQLLTETDCSLSAAGIEDARIESRMLLAHAVNTSSSRLLSRLDESVPPEVRRRFAAMIERRLAGEPIAHILGAREFCGLMFRVTPDTLIPRPETEILVEKAIELANANGPAACTIVDVGTGSGCIAVSLAVNLQRAEVYAVDRSRKALEVAAWNAAAHGVETRVHPIQGDLLEAFRRPVDMIVANLPYVTDAEMVELPDEVRLYEPVGALAGGRDGLDYIRRLVGQARFLLGSRGSMLLEIGAFQREAAAQLVRDSFPAREVTVIRDYAGLDRIVALLPERLA